MYELTIPGSTLPSCSVKDRIAVNMVQRAEEQGLISPGKTVLVRTVPAWKRRDVPAKPGRRCE